MAENVIHFPHEYFRRRHLFLSRTSPDHFSAAETSQKLRSCLCLLQAQSIHHRAVKFQKRLCFSALTRFPMYHNACQYNASFSPFPGRVPSYFPDCCPVFFLIIKNPRTLYNMPAAGFCTAFSLFPLFSLQKGAPCGTPLCEKKYINFEASFFFRTVFPGFTDARCPHCTVRSYGQRRRIRLC